MFKEIEIGIFLLTYQLKETELLNKISYFRTDIETFGIRNKIETQIYYSLFSVLSIFKKIYIYIYIYSHSFLKYLAKYFQLVA